MIRDFLFALRLAGRYRLQSVAIVLTLAVGLGLVTATYSVVYGRFIRALPFQGADRMVGIERLDAEGQPQPLQLAAVELWRAEPGSLQEVMAWVPISASLGKPGEPAEQLVGAFVSTNFLDLCSVAPQRGRAFEPTDGIRGAPPVLLISDRIWRTRFGGQNVIGETLRLFGEPMTVVGVLPPDFNFPVRQDFWAPLVQSPGYETDGEEAFVQVIGLLRNDQSRRQASAELNARFTASEDDSGQRIRVSGFTELYSNRDLRQQYFFMLAATFLLLLLCCANAGNVLLSRADLRKRELAVRVALGAPPSSLVRLIFVDVAFYGLVAGVAGFFFAWVAMRAYSRWTAEELVGFWNRVELDAPVFAFGLAMVLLTIVLCGAVTAWSCLRMGRGSHAGDRQLVVGVRTARTRWLEPFLVAGQTAVSFALLVAMLLVVQSGYRLDSQDVGFDREGVLTAGLTLYGESFPTRDASVDKFQEIAKTLQTVPGVEQVGWTYHLPGLRDYEIVFTSEDSEDQRMTRFSIVDPGYFAVFRIRTVRGRLIDDGDRAESEKVTVVNQSFAKRFFPQLDPLGKKIQVANSWWTIVGIVPDVLIGQIESETSEALYLGLAQYPVQSLRLVVRSSVQPETLMRPIRTVVAEIVPDQALYVMRSMDDTFLWATRFYSASRRVFVVLGLVAFLLTALGLYALASLQVTRRFSEFGIKKALGAQPRQILTGVLRRGLVWTLWGLAAGLVLVLNFNHLLAAFLFQLATWNPALYLTAAGTLLLVTFLACLVPARRAASVNPARTLFVE